MDTLEQAVSNSTGALPGFVARLEDRYDARDEVNADIKIIYGEAREAGISVRHLRIVVREKRMEPDVRNEHYTILESMRFQLGMLAGTPLGEAAIEAASRIVPRKPGRPRKVRPVDPRVEVAPETPAYEVPGLHSNRELASQGPGYARPEPYPA